MTRRRDSRIKIQLQPPAHTFIDTKAVIRFSIEVFFQFRPHEEGDDDSDEEGDEPAEGSTFFVSCVGLFEGVERY